MEYDIVFWAHGYNETERFLPLMVSLKARGVSVLLFYQNYDFQDDLSCFHQMMAVDYGLDILDYSYFLKSDLFLRIATIFVKFFKHAIKTPFFYNKFRGLRTKLLQRHITEELIERIVNQFKQKISFFDNLSLLEYRSYPYGSYYIKKVSEKFKIKCLSITHGGSGYKVELETIKKSHLDFDKIYVPNDYEKKSFERQCLSEATPVLALGDPRFDDNWKSEIKRLFSEEVKAKVEKMDLKRNLKILYLFPNIEALGKGSTEKLKYQHLNDIVRLFKSLGDMELLIKPHPRYRNERKIRKVMAKMGLRDFIILDDDPLICYLDFVDFIISPGTSALFDVLPEGHKKVIVLDNFFPHAKVENIFTEHLNSFDSYEGVFNFLSKRAIDRQSQKADAGKVLDFCREWTAGNRNLDAVISSITDDIYHELIQT